MPADTTPPPAYLDDESVRLWRKTKRQLNAQGTWQDSDAPLLERYIDALQRAREARARIEWREGLGEAQSQAGEERTFWGWTALGSQRQLVQHPDVKTLREAQQDAHRYAEALLLTPAARERASVEPPETGGKFGVG
jgi:P27 family predicted phage terminase small subunit